MIPKTIWTIWLSEDRTMPELFNYCVGSQKQMCEKYGYEHKIITLQNWRQDPAWETFKRTAYVEQALAAKAWVKAADYLRVFLLYHYGGIYLDADVKMIPERNFDKLLKHKMFAAREQNGFIGSAVMGAEPLYPFLEKWLDKIDQDFRGDDGKNFESSMDLLVRGYFEWDWPKEGFELLPTETLYPYDHQSGEINVTEDTITYHYFAKTWL